MPKLAQNPEEMLYLCRLNLFVMLPKGVQEATRQTRAEKALIMLQKGQKTLKT